MTFARIPDVNCSTAQIGPLIRLPINESNKFCRNDKRESSNFSKIQNRRARTFMNPFCAMGVVINSAGLKVLIPPKNVLKSRLNLEIKPSLI